MSFVSNLRMRNMFPINSDMGSAEIDLSGPDPMDEIINAAMRLRQSNQSSGVQQVADVGNSRQSPVAQPSLQFGGVRGDSNPGADILNRARFNAERMYKGYSEPLNPPVTGPSNDEIDLENYFKRKNEEKRADATLAAAGTKGWKTVTITDPNDPSKQINARINEVTGETQPIELPGIITRTGSAKDMQATLDAKKKQSANLESLRSRTTDTLALMDELLDPITGKMNETVGKVTGWSRMLGHGYLPEGQGSIAKINRLKNNLTLDLIKEMKEQSRTGATGFGALNLKELGVLENAASMLDSRGMSDEQYEEELGRIRDRLRMILQDTTEKQSGAPSREQMLSSGRIRVRDKRTGQTGTISEGAFNPQKYDKVQ